MKYIRTSLKYIKEYSYLICAAVILMYFVFVIGYSVLQGIDRIVTQEEIDATYRIER